MNDSGQGAGARWRAVALAATLGVAGHLTFDAWYRDALLARERARVASSAEPYAKAVQGVFDRRIGRLAGLRAFVEGKQSADAVYREFPTFAAGLRAAVTDVRAVQLVRDGRITASFPADEGARLVGYNLLQHPDPNVVADVVRAGRVDSVVITGPLALLQGGRGLLMRQRVATRARPMPDLVTLVLDAEALLNEAEWARHPSEVAMALLDRAGQVVRGEPERLEDPVRLQASIGDGALSVLAAPVDGWAAAIAPDRRMARITTAFIAALLVALAWGVGGREERLAAAVAARTRALEEANQRLREESQERLALEDRLLQTQKMEALGTLAGGVAHDFNNLLTAMLGFAQLAEQALRDRQAVMPDEAHDERQLLESVQTDLEEIHKAADRATLLTRQLLAFSRRQQVSARPHDLVGVVLDIERMLQRLLGAHVTLRTETPAQPVPVLADGGQLAQVLVNLVVNARDAVRDGGQITVRVGTRDLATAATGALQGLPAGRWALLSVVDNGVGMSPEVQTRMFEPFFTTKAVGVGTGLGLSTVYGIVTQAGGQLFVQSAPGAGTTVTVAFPRLSELPASMSAPVPRTPQSHTDALVLVVEDEAGLRRLVAEILRRSGYRVEVAEDGVAALAHIDGGLRPALVITDVVMPRMGGRELAEAIGARRDPPPVLFMSGFQGGEALPDDARHSFIGKPFSPEDLATRVRETLATVID